MVMGNGDAALQEPRTGRVLSGKNDGVTNRGIEARPRGPPSREEAIFPAVDGAGVTQGELELNAGERWLGSTGQGVVRMGVQGL